MSSPPPNDAPVLAASEEASWPAISENLSLPNGNSAKWPALNAAGWPALSMSKWFTKEIQPHERSLRSYLHGAFPTVAEIDDVVQESYLRTLRARAAQPIRSARAFLFIVARRLALDTLRHKRASPIDDRVHLEALHVIDDGADVADAVARRERISIMADAIADLPTRCRDVFILHKIKGCSRRETAAQLGLAEKTVEVHTANAMRRCGNYLRRHGVTGP